MFTYLDKKEDAQSKWISDRSVLTGAPWNNFSPIELSYYDRWKLDSEGKYIDTSSGGEKLKLIDSLVGQIAMENEQTEKASLAIDLRNAIMAYQLAHASDGLKRKGFDELKEDIQLITKITSNEVQANIAKFEQKNPILKQAVIATLASLDPIPMGLFGQLTSDSGDVVSSALGVAGVDFKMFDVSGNSVISVSTAAVRATANWAEGKYKIEGGSTTSAWTKLKDWVLKKIIDLINAVVPDRALSRLRNVGKFFLFMGKVASLVASTIFNYTIPLLDNLIGGIEAIAAAVDARAQSFDFSEAKEKVIGLMSCWNVVFNSMRNYLQDKATEAMVAAATSVFKLGAEIAGMITTAGAATLGLKIVDLILGALKLLYNLVKRYFNYAKIADFKAELDFIAGSPTMMLEVPPPPPTRGRRNAIVGDIPHIEEPKVKLNSTVKFESQWYSSESITSNLSESQRAFDHLMTYMSTEVPVYAALLLNSGLLDDPDELFHPVNITTATEKSEYEKLKSSARSASLQYLQEFQSQGGLAFRFLEHANLKTLPTYNLIKSNILKAKISIETTGAFLPAA